jgi:hypothetical protein
MVRSTPVPLDPLAQNLSLPGKRRQFMKRATTARRGGRYRIAGLSMWGRAISPDWNESSSGANEPRVFAASTQVFVASTQVFTAKTPIVAKQFCRGEHQVIELRRKSRLHKKPIGITPDFVRLELDSPSPLTVLDAGQRCGTPQYCRPPRQTVAGNAASIQAGVRPLQHFSLAQPYF